MHTHVMSQCFARSTWYLLHVDVRTCTYNSIHMYAIVVYICRAQLNDNTYGVGLKFVGVAAQGELELQCSSLIVHQDCIETHVILMHNK